MGDTKNFPYPVEWEDDQRMNVLFSPFRENRHVNPQSWDSKLKFWSDLLASYCKFTGRIIITPTEVPHMFQRKGRLPQCINKVLEENLRFAFILDRVSVPSPIAIEILMDTMARDRAHMYLFSV